jgi:hypothetical protein
LESILLKLSEASIEVSIDMEGFESNRRWAQENVAEIHAWLATNGS